MAGSRSDKSVKATSGGGTHNLFAAIEKNDIAGIKKALDYMSQTNPNALLDAHHISGKTAIFYAIQCHSVEALRTLLEYASTHKLLGKLLTQKDESGYTPLVRAIWHEGGEKSNLDMVTVLLQSVEQKKSIMTEMLSIQDNSGKTPIMHAISRDYASIVSLLLEHGSPLEKKTNVQDYQTIRGPVKNCENILQQYIGSTQRPPLASPSSSPSTQDARRSSPNHADKSGIDLLSSLEEPEVDLLSPDQSFDDLELAVVEEDDVEFLSDSKLKTQTSPTTTTKMPVSPQQSPQPSKISKPTATTAARTYRKSITNIKEGDNPPTQSHPRRGPGSTNQ